MNQPLSRSHLVIKPRPRSTPPAQPRPLEAGVCSASCRSVTRTVPGTNRGFAHRTCGAGHKRKGRQREARELGQDHTAACPPRVTAGIGAELIWPQCDFALLLHLLEGPQPPLDRSLSRLPPPSGAREAVRAPRGSSVDCPAPAARACPHVLLSPRPAGRRELATCGPHLAAGVFYTTSCAVRVCARVCRGFYLITWNHLPTLKNWGFHIKTRVSSFC